MNPTTWSTEVGFSQAIEVSHASRILFCSGQAAIGPDGPPVVDIEMDDQVRLALSNLVSVLAAADMTPHDVVKVTLYTTDVDEFLESYRHQAPGVFGDTLPAATLIGVSQLAYPDMKLEIEAIAVR